MKTNIKITKHREDGTTIDQMTGSVTQGSRLEHRIEFGQIRNPDYERTLIVRGLNPLTISATLQRAFEFEGAIEKTEVKSGGIGFITYKKDVARSALFRLSGQNQKLHLDGCQITVERAEPFLPATHTTVEIWQDDELAVPEHRAPWGACPELPPFYSLRHTDNGWVIDPPYFHLDPVRGTREEAVKVAWETFRDYGDRAWFDWIVGDGDDQAEGPEEEAPNRAQSCRINWTLARRYPGPLNWNPNVWEEIECLGDDANTARRFVETRFPNIRPGEILMLAIKAGPSASVRSLYRFDKDPLTHNVIQFRVRLAGSLGGDLFLPWGEVAPTNAELMLQHAMELGMLADEGDGLGICVPCVPSLTYRDVHRVFSEFQRIAPEGDRWTMALSTKPNDFVESITLAKKLQAMASTQSQPEELQAVPAQARYQTSTPRPKMCSGKAFFLDGTSIGWDALEDLGDDAETARHFVMNRVTPLEGDIVDVAIKGRLGATVRSLYRFGRDQAGDITQELVIPQESIKKCSAKLSFLSSTLIPPRWHELDDIGDDAKTAWNLAEDQYGGVINPGETVLVEISDVEDGSVRSQHRIKRDRETRVLVNEQAPEDTQANDQPVFGWANYQDSSETDPYDPNAPSARDSFDADSPEVEMHCNLSEAFFESCDADEVSAMIPGEVTVRQFAESTTSNLPSEWWMRFRNLEFGRVAVDFVRDFRAETSSAKDDRSDLEAIAEIVDQPLSARDAIIDTVRKLWADRIPGWTIRGATPESSVPAMQRLCGVSSTRMSPPGPLSTPFVILFPVTDNGHTEEHRLVIRETANDASDSHLRHNVFPRPPSPMAMSNTELREFYERMGSEKRSVSYMLDVRVGDDLLGNERWAPVDAADWVAGTWLTWMFRSEEGSGVGHVEIHFSVDTDPYRLVILEGSWDPHIEKLQGYDNLGGERWAEIDIGSKPDLTWMVCIATALSEREEQPGEFYVPPQMKKEVKPS